MAQLLPELNSLAQPFVKLHMIVVTSRHSGTKDDPQGIWVLDDVTETQLPINIADGTKVLISRKQIY